MEHIETASTGAFTNYGRILRLAASRHEDRPFLIFDGRMSTYGDFNRHVNRLANALLKRGVKSGDRVLTWAYNSDEMLALMFAAAKLGAVMVPVNTMLVRESVEGLIKRLKPSVIAADGQRANELHDAGVSSEVLLALPEDSGTVVPGESWTTVSMLTQGENSREPDGVELVDTKPGMILFTSGSTASPRGVVKSFSSLSWHAINYRLAAPRSTASVELIALQLAGIVFANFVLPAILGGATIVLMRRYTAAGALATIQEHGVTHMFLPPTMILPVLDLAEAGAGSLQSVEFFHTAYALTAAQRQRVIDLMPSDCQLHYGYGSTEGSMFLSEPGAFGDDSNVVGVPSGIDEFRIASTAGTVLGANETGEIQVSGPSVMLGYLDHEPDAKTADGWLRTGDLGEYDDRGQLHFRGRLKDMIKTGGHNVFAGDVEAALAEHPRVKDACVIGVPDDYWGEAVTAIITPASCREAEEDIETFMKGRVPGYMRPKRYLYLDQLPVNPTGKVVKQTAFALASADGGV
jgi:acyl-CoA synthetase (AMP-forming)/AMP-acid ligase II